MTATWWAKKLGTPEAHPGTVPDARTFDRPTMPAPQPVPALPSMTVTVGNFAEATAAWQGGPAARTESQPCPNCGSNLFFSRSNGGSAVAPRCYSCGYTQGRPMQGMPL